MVMCLACVIRDPLNFSYENPSSPSERERKVKRPNRQRKPLHTPSYRKLPTEREGKKRKKGGPEASLHIISATHFKVKRSKVSREIGKHGGG